MSFQGEISSMALGDVVQNLVANRKTGILHIEAPELVCEIWFEDGVIVSYTDRRGIDIAPWLVEKGIVAPQSMEEALKRLKRSRRRSLGETLARARILPLDDYKARYANLIHDALCEAFTLPDGKFDFHDMAIDEARADPEMRRLGIRFAAQSVVMEAVRRADDWTRIRRYLPPESEIWQAAPGALERLGDDEANELTVHAIESLDGTSTLRQVIARLPCSRFDAVRTLADLVARKLIRPVESDKIIEGIGLAPDPDEAISRLEAVLEREPSNLVVHAKLAALLEDEKRFEESAKHNKVLANAYLEEGDRENARKYLRRVVELNGRDILAWQKLWSLELASANDDEIRAFARRFLDHFKKLGLTEIVRDHLIALSERFANDFDVRTELAETHFTIGDHKAGIQVLFDVGHAYLREERYREAERAFAKILAYDAGNERAKKLCTDIREGRLERRRAWRRRLLRESVLGSFLALAVAFIVREVQAQYEIIAVLRKAVAESIVPRETRESVAAEIDRLGVQYPLSPSISLDGDAVARTLGIKRSEADPSAKPEPETETSKAPEAANDSSRLDRSASDEPIRIRDRRKS